MDRLRAAGYRWTSSRRSRKACARYVQDYLTQADPYA